MSNASNSMTNKGFSHVGLSTLDLDKTREFGTPRGSMKASNWSTTPGSIACQRRCAGWLRLR